MDEGSVTKIKIDPGKFDPDNLWYIRWVDSRRLSDGWVIADTVVSASLVCHSVGYLADDMGSSVVLVPHVAEMPFQILGGLEIHKKSILEKRRLKVSK